MVRYDSAVGAEDEAPSVNEARTWLLAYNRGDVEATALRDWLDRTGASIPSIRFVPAASVISPALCQARSGSRHFGTALRWPAVAS